VVDARGQVHGIDRLHAVDVSIKPAIPAANTNLSTLMVAGAVRGLAARQPLRLCSAIIRIALDLGMGKDRCGASHA
jgi:choline dehydrogenase-like flavoprotein